MIVFLFIYVLFFFIALTGILRGQTERILLFVIFSLPLYFTALSIAHKYGLTAIVPVFQFFKELIVIVTLIVLLYHRKTAIRFHLIDWLVTAYFAYSLLYVLLPLGNFGFSDRLLALKGLAFFPLVYFTGRLMDFRAINFNRYFSYICIVSILAGCVMVYEVIQYEHFQAYTGYAEFNQYFFNQDPGGNFGLSWTFETSKGLKRFASFYGGPLEMGVNTVCTVSVVIALATSAGNKFKPDKLQLLTLLFSFFAIAMALSRASFASYFIIIYVYAFLTNKRLLIKLFHWGMIGAVLLVLVWLKGDIYDWIIGTIDFSDSSSAFHIIQWLDGLQAIAGNPLGLGLGMAGRVAGATDSNIGGENQLIITGVQTGLIAVGLYLAIYISTITTCVKLFRNSQDKTRKPALALFLIKLGLIIPMLTANTESYIYMSYLSWLLTGCVVGMIMNRVPAKNAAASQPAFSS